MIDQIYSPIKSIIVNSVALDVGRSNKGDHFLDQNRPVRQVVQRLSAPVNRA